MIPGPAKVPDMRMVAFGAAVVEHRLGEILEKRAHLAAITGKLAQGCREPRPGTFSGDHDPLRVYAEFTRRCAQPEQSRVAILERTRKRSFRR